MKTDSTKQTSVVTQLLIAGSAACFADAATFPFDTAKVRLQLQGESTIPTNRRVASHEMKNPMNMVANKQPFISGAASNARGFISTAVPVPTASIENAPKNAMNIQYRGLFGTIATIARTEGPRSLYNGLSAGLQRQAVFASVRLGMYDSVKATYRKLFNEKPDGLHVSAHMIAATFLSNGDFWVFLNDNF